MNCERSVLTPLNCGFVAFNLRYRVAFGVVLFYTPINCIK